MHIPFVNVSIFGSFSSHFVFIFGILAPMFDVFSKIWGGEVTLWSVRFFVDDFFFTGGGQ